MFTLVIVVIGQPHSISRVLALLRHYNIANQTTGMTNIDIKTLHCLYYTNVLYQGYKFEEVGDIRLC